MLDVGTTKLHAGVGPNVDSFGMHLVGKGVMWRCTHNENPLYLFFLQSFGKDTPILTYRADRDKLENSIYAEETQTPIPWRSQTL